MPPRFDVLSIGRISVDIYPDQIGLDIEDVTRFGKYVGGSATNVAIAAARLGRHVALLTKTGADPFGAYLRRELAHFGVATEFVGQNADYLTPVTFCAIKPPDDFPLYFYRAPSAPDLQITVTDLMSERLTLAISTARVYWATLTGLSQEPSRSAHQLAWHMRSRFADDDAWTILDLDFRPALWRDPAKSAKHVRAALPLVNAVVGNAVECANAVGPGTPDELADRLLAAGPRLAIVKLGAAGALAATADERVRCAAIPVDVVNGLGAGDAFGGALCHGLLAGWPLELTLEFANAAGAQVATKLACSSAMPPAADVVRLLHEHGRPVPAEIDT